MKKYLIIFLIIFIGVIPASFNIIDSHVKSSSVKFYEAPNIFCETKFRGITLPPIGIFVCPEVFNNKQLRAHELVHWDQYKNHGTIGFYLRYLWGMLENGFDYESHFMEIDARKRSSNFIE